MAPHTHHQVAPWAQRTAVDIICFRVPRVDEATKQLLSVLYLSCVRAIYFSPSSAAGNRRACVLDIGLNPSLVQYKRPTWYRFYCWSRFDCSFRKGWVLHICMASVFGRGWNLILPGEVCSCIPGVFFSVRT